MAGTVSSSLPWSWRLTAAVLLAVGFLHLTLITAPVRLANDDDVKFQAVIRDPNPKAVSDRFVELSQKEARFYFAVSTYRLPYYFYRIDSAVLFSLCRIALLFSQVTLLGALLARLSRNEAIGWLYVVVAVNALHIPALFYPVLSSLAYSVGSIAQLASLHCFLSYCRQRRAGPLLAAGVFQLLALLYHENFVIFTVLYPALACADASGQKVRAALKSGFVPLLVSVAYLGSYVCFKLAYPSQYDGTVLVFSPGETLQSWFRQTFSALPGFELFRARTEPYPNAGPLWKNAGDFANLARSLNAAGLILAAVSALVALRLGRRSLRGGLPGWTVNGLLVVATALPNLLPSLTEKYQVSAHHRFYPYVYGFTAYCWAIAAAIGLSLYGLARIRPDTGRARVAGGMIGLLVLLLFLSAYSSNQYTLARLRLWYN